MRSPNPFKVLEAHKQMTLEQLRDCYMAKAKLYHPDAVGSYDKLEDFTKVANAYKDLTDPKRRNVMLAMLAMRGITCRKCAGEGALSKSVSMTTKIHIRCEHCAGSGYIQKENDDATDAGGQDAAKHGPEPTEVPPARKPKIRRYKSDSAE